MIPRVRRAMGVLAIALLAAPLVGGFTVSARGLDVVAVLDLVSPLPGEDLLSPLPSVDLELPLPSDDLLSPLPSVDLLSPLPSDELLSPLPSVDLLSPLPSVDLLSPLPSVDLLSPLPSASVGILPTPEPSEAGAPSVQGGEVPPASSPAGGVGSAATGSRAIVPEGPPLGAALPGDSWLVPALSVAVPVLIVGALVVLQVLGGAAALRVARAALDRLGVAAPPWLRQDSPAP